jgi:NADPH-dependent ferric siderophore reductase
MTTTGRGPAGGIEGALTRLFTRSATVSQLRVLDERFRLVTLSGEALRGVRWAPGQKLQVALGGWVYRTYTPLCWDALAGSTQLLLFLHGESPGSAWGRALQVGDPCMLFGPRDSLDLSRLARPGLLFGDETSFALAHALRFTPGGAAGVRMVLEVDEQRAARDILEHIGIGDAELIERKPDDSHSAEVERIAVELLQAHSIKSCALSGKASSIQRLSKRLRALGLSRREIQTRAYWAPGKVGLD